MSFTSRLGQPQSGLGNVQLGGSVTILPVPVTQTIPARSLGYFTGQLGINLSSPGNIVPGRPFSRLNKAVSLAANFIPTALLVPIHYYSGALRESAVATYRAVSRAFTFITQKRTF